MNDVLLNTLLATLVMCQQHFVAADGDMHVTRFQPGFEKCSKVQAAVEAEQQRRSAAEKQAKEAVDKALLANGLDALDGKKFEPKGAPKPQQSLWNSDCCSYSIPYTPTESHPL